jgi:hypothetical protein
VARCAHCPVRSGEGTGAEGAEMVAPLAATLAVNEDSRSECKLRTCRALALTTRDNNDNSAGYLCGSFCSHIIIAKRSVFL